MRTEHTENEIKIINFLNWRFSTLFDWMTTNLCKTVLVLTFDGWSSKNVNVVLVTPFPAPCPAHFQLKSSVELWQHWDRLQVLGIRRKLPKENHYPLRPSLRFQTQITILHLGRLLSALHSRLLGTHSRAHCGRSL